MTDKETTWKWGTCEFYGEVCQKCGGVEKYGPKCEAKKPVSDKETLAQWMVKQGYATGHGDTVEDLLAELEWQLEVQRKMAVSGGVMRCLNVLERLNQKADGRHNYYGHAANIIREMD